MTAANITAVGPGAAADGPAQAPGGGRRGGRLREALRSPRLAWGIGIVGFFVLLGVIGPFFISDPNQIGGPQYAGPSARYWLGTTQTGQDVFAQLVVSTRISLEIGAGAGLLATIVSVAIGISGGYAGGIADEALSLLSNVALVIPTLPLIIVILAYTKSDGIVPLILIIALTSLAASARSFFRLDR